MLDACDHAHIQFSASKHVKAEIVDTAALNLENERLKDSIDQAERLIAQPVQNPNPFDKSPEKSKGKGKGRSKGKGHKNK